MKKGKVIILSGVSSIGKDAIKELLMNDPQLNLMDNISLTTRPKRDTEKDGKDYYFVDHKSFADAVLNHQMLEYTEFNGYYYGTPSEHVEFLTSMGKNVLISVEAQGVGQIRIKHPDNLAFFLVPTCFEDFEKQIYARYEEDKASALLRVNKAKTEMELAGIFGTCVPLTTQQEAYEKIREELLKNLYQ